MPPTAAAAYALGPSPLTRLARSAAASGGMCRGKGACCAGVGALSACAEVLRRRGRHMLIVTVITEALRAAHESPSRAA